MASLACSISSLKAPQSINPRSSQKLLGFNYLSTQFTLKLSPIHQPPFPSTTRPSNNFTITASSPNVEIPVDIGENKPLHVLAINEQDTVNSAGNLVPICNNIYTAGNRKKLLGITSGVCKLKVKNGDSYEAKYDFHFENYGHVSVKGKCCSIKKDTYLNVIGGSGIFEGVQGMVKLKHIKFPVELFYTFYFVGIENLPNEMMD